MGLRKGLHLSLLLFVGVDIAAAPMVQKIVNNTNVGFLIVEHSDTSSCSLQGRRKVIAARSTFTDSFLLEPGKPSLVLRPIYYLDTKTNKPLFFADVDRQEIPIKLQAAYDIWKMEKNSSNKVKSPKAWLHDWIGLDLSVTPHEVEILGYLVNLSRVRVENNKKSHVQWLSFSKGIFSKLVLELDIKQHHLKGISATIKVLHGEGGFCSDGVVLPS
ncbi:MAG: hypothetical protein WC747_02550 [Candidatus Babeliales bacterium]